MHWAYRYGVKTPPKFRIFESRCPTGILGSVWIWEQGPLNLGILGLPFLGILLGFSPRNPRGAVWIENWESSPGIRFGMRDVCVYPELIFKSLFPLILGFSGGRTLMKILPPSSSSSPIPHPELFPIFPGHPHLPPPAASSNLAPIPPCSR